MKSIYEIEAEKARKAGEMLIEKNKNLAIVEKNLLGFYFIIACLIVMLIGAGTEMFG